MRSNLSRSPSNILAIGMPVHRETTSATSSSVTRERSRVGSGKSSAEAACNRRSRSGSKPCCISDILVRSPARRATSKSSLACSMSLLIWVAPCTAAFSASQTSSRSAYSRSIPAICSSSCAISFSAAADSSFFTASRSIFS